MIQGWVPQENPWYDEIKIKDPNENGEGEILIRGKTVMLGYYEDAEATAAAIDGGRMVQFRRYRLYG